MIDKFSMFKNAHVFNQDIVSWDVSNGTNMINLFEFASDFIKI